MSVVCPEGLIFWGRSQSIPYAAMGNIASKWYGIQYHPEVYHTQYGMQMLQNFVYKNLWVQGELDDGFIFEGKN